MEKLDIYDLRFTADFIFSIIRSEETWHSRSKLQYLEIHYHVRQSDG
jgi:hypothetical protein